MTQTMRRMGAALCAALFGIVAACAGAQTITGSIGGAVTDPSGAVIPNATVTVKNLGTGVQTVTHSDQSGVYNFQFLPIGSYSITGVCSRSRNPIWLKASDSHGSDETAVIS